MTKDNDMQNSQLRKPWHRPVKDDKLKLRNRLNLLFMLLAVASVVLYFVLPRPQGMPYFYVCCFFAVIIKGVEVCIRMLPNKNDRK